MNELIEQEGYVLVEESSGPIHLVGPVLTREQAIEKAKAIVQHPSGVRPRVWMVPVIRITTQRIEDGAYTP